MFPPSDVLDLVDNEDFAFSEKLDQGLIQIVCIFCLEPKEAIIFKVKIIERLLSQFMSHLGQQGGFSHPA